jgi:hypothetical protein
MDLALSIVSWVVAALALVGFAGLAGYGLRLRRAARRDGGALGPRRAQDAGALAAVAVVLLLGAEVALVPFYVRSAVGRHVRAAFLEARSEGGRSRVYTLRAAYKDGSGKMQTAEARVSGGTYLRYYEMSFDCHMADVQAIVDREYAKAGQPSPPRLTTPGKGCEPIDFIVVDGFPRFAQIGTEPAADTEVLVGVMGLWGLLLLGMLREASRAKASRPSS